MAIQKEIEIIAKTDEAEKDIKKVDSNIKNLDKSAANANKGISNMAKRFKAVGTALKAAGIAALIGLFVTLKETLSQNQKVVDAFNSAFTAVSVTINTVADALFNSSAGFYSLGKVAKGVLDVVLYPFETVFLGIKAAIIGSQLVWEQSFFGGNDEETIERLNKQLDETKKRLIENSEEVLESGKVIFSNFKDAANELVTAAQETSEALEKVSVKSAIEQGKRLVQLQKEAEIAEVVNQGLIEKYDSQAEKLRQIRDDDTKSIAERIKANNELQNVLDEQVRVMQENAAIVVANAQAQYNANKTQENYLALLSAQNEQLAINAQVEGYRSEQIVNEVSLRKEQIELEKSLTDAQIERNITQLEFDAEQEENELRKLEIQQEVIDKEREMLEAKIENERSIYAEGTQARVDAENEYLSQKQELANRETAINNSKNTTILKNDEELESARGTLAQNSLALLQQVAGENRAIQAGVALANTWQGVTEVWKTPSTLPEPLATANRVVSTGVVLASGLSAVKNIDATGATGSSGSTSTTSPSFNLIEGTSEARLSSDITTSNNTPVKAYVVSRDISTEIEYDNRIDGDATY